MLEVGILALIALSVQASGVPKPIDSVEPVVVDPRLQVHLDAFNEQVLARSTRLPTEEEGIEIGRLWLDELVSDYGRDETISMLTEVIIADSDERFVRVLRSSLLEMHLYDKHLALVPEDILRAVAPHYPAERSAAYEPNVHMLLHMAVEVRNPDLWNTDFEPAAKVLRDAWGAGLHDYDGLVDFMFDYHAIAAWMTMTQLEGADADEVQILYNRLLPIAGPYQGKFGTNDNPSTLNPDDIREARELLTVLMKDSSLWARVFVAEVLETVPFLRDPAIEEALRADPHWLIQRRLKYLDEDEAESEPPAPAE